jgi:flagellar biosynthesis/type III secretory pathway protein FliH
MSEKRDERAKALRERHEESWKLLEDDSLQPGGCWVETAHSRIAPQSSDWAISFICVLPP